MTTTRHPQSLPLSRGSEIEGSYVGAEREARARWEALVDARLIGNAQPLSAEAHISSRRPNRSALHFKCFD